MKVGDTCRHGHTAETEADLRYYSRDGKEYSECRKCTRLNANRRYVRKFRKRCAGVTVSGKECQTLSLTYFPMGDTSPFYCHSHKGQKESIK